MHSYCCILINKTNTHAVWSRPPSQHLTSALLTQGSKYHDTLQAAQKADRIVRAKVNNWSKAIEALSKPIPDLIRSLPSVTDDENSQYPTDLLERIRVLLQECDESQARRQYTMDEARSLAAADDISEALLAKAAALTNGSPIVKLEPEQFNDVFTRELKKYEGLQAQVEQFTQKHSHLLLRLREAHEQFFLVVQGNSTVARREKAIRNLEQAFVKLKEIRVNLVEGIKVSSKMRRSMNSIAHTPLL